MSSGEYVHNRFRPRHRFCAGGRRECDRIKSVVARPRSVQLHDKCMLMLGTVSFWINSTRFDRFTDVYDVFACESCDIKWCLFDQNITDFTRRIGENVQFVAGQHGIHISPR
jgi:hypothetical protein